MVTPTQGELYYLRILLYNVPGPTSYEDLRTYDGTVCCMFQEACRYRGLIETDNEWDRCLEEAASFQTGPQFQLFAVILLMNDPSDPTSLFKRHFQALSDDCRYLLQSRFHIDVPTNDEIQSFTLQKLAHLLEKSEKRLEDYKLPLPTVAFHSHDRIYIQVPIVQGVAFRIQFLDPLKTLVNMSSNVIRPSRGLA